jgi:LPXTG-site transpeptidase (sortase) family protein
MLRGVRARALRLLTGPAAVVGPGAGYAGLQHGRPYPVAPRRPAAWALEVHPVDVGEWVRAARPRRRIPALPAVAVVALTVPWVVPGFSQAVAEAVAPTRVVQVVERVVDPAVLPADGFIGPRPVSSDVALHGRARGAGTPSGISVPRLQVDSSVVPISGATGVLLPPSDPQVIGWWREGRVPGAGRGTAVLTGHTVHTGGGAFDHLDALLPGDQVEVRTDHGVVSYRVRSVTDYEKGALAAHAQEIFRRTGPGRLVLITCSQWDGHEYLANTVVDAVPVS